MAEKMWHSISWQEAVREFNSDAENGLSEKEVSFRQEKIGKNKLAEEKPLSGIIIFLRQFKSPLIYILFAAGLVILFFKEWADAAIIFGAVLLNTAVGFFQESKASQALRALKKMVKIEARVIRDGDEKRADSEDLVPGDIVVLTAGNKVPADARLIEAHHLRIQEAPLTGEWLAAQKVAGVLPQDIPLADRENMVYAGCVVENGKGRAIITATGNSTEIGKVATMVREAEEIKTPLQNKIAKFGAVIGIVVAVIVFFIFIQGILKGRDPLEMFMTSVAVAVAAIPEGLPVAMTVILALGMQRILKKKGLVRKLLAAEVLGSTSIIATDKTLTLTEGRMKVSKIFAENNDNALLFKIVISTSETLGSPTDRALLSAGEEAGFNKIEISKAYQKIDEILFDHKNKFVAVLVGTKEKRQLLFVSGAPEKIIGLSRLDEETSARLDYELRDLAGSGLRVVAAAYKEVINRKIEISDLQKEIHDLIFAGFIGLNDPLRPEAKTAISLCREAGMRPIIVTGDHLLTAKAVAKELGLGIGSRNIVEGKDLDVMSDREFQERIEDIDIYARVEPHHKLKIVEAWQGRGHVVAMTGDGINDAPALRRADIGVALGSGTDVAKEVSDLILLTDSFDIIVSAVEEGRAIMDNIRKVITYLLSDSFAETILVGLSIVFGLPLPITAAQILWINLIEDGLPNIALAFEPKEKDVLKRKPENSRSNLLTRGMKVIIFVIGIITDLLLFLFFWWLFRKGLDQNYITTMIFATLGTDSLLYVFSCKNLKKNIWQINLFNNKFLIFGAASGFLMMGLAVYLPPLQSLLGTTPLGFQDWLIVLGIGLLNIILIEAVKYYFIKKHKITNR